MNTTREEIKALLAATCPDWEVTYEASRLMNVKATEKNPDARFIYIEEFTSGKYMRPVGRPGRTRMTRVQIWFCSFKLSTQPNTRDRVTTAEQRELVREMVETEAVLPFLDGFYASAKFTSKPTEVPFATPLPRFADQEVSVMIELDVQLAGGC